jgi:hypothetical protein
MAFLITMTTVKAQSVSGPLLVKSLGAPVDAYSSSMGGTTYGMDPDANSGWKNIAKYSSIYSVDGDNTDNSNIFLGANYKPWNGATLETFSVAGTIKDCGSIFVGVQLFNGGDALAVAQNNTPLKSFVGIVGYALPPIANDFYFSVAGKLIYSKLNSSAVTAGGEAVDISWFYSHIESEYLKLNAGLTIANIGPELKYDSSPEFREFLPTTIGLGVSETITTAFRNKWTIGLDINRDLYPATPTNAADSIAYQRFNYQQSLSHSNKKLSFSAGGEYLFRFNHHDQIQFAFRGGFISDHDNKYYDGLTTGAGIIFQDFHLDLAYFINSSHLSSEVANNFPYGHSVQATISKKF